MLSATNSPDGLLVQAESIARRFDFGPEDVAKTTRFFVEQMRSGLKCNGATQIPSFVTRVPDGSETGVYLAVDLGGTNCRICSVNLHGDSTYTVVQSKHAIPRNVMVNSSYKPLFNFIAGNIKQFLEDHPEANIKRTTDLEKPRRDDRRRSLGFTFSFTYSNDSLSSGTVIQWDKGWDIPEALGRDPCEMLQNAIDDLGLPVLVSALTNDSVGTLMARAYTSPWRSATLVGAIFGTGTNAAYIERLDNIRSLESQVSDAESSEDGQMIINTEWGAWADSTPTALPTASFDRVLDTASSNPGVQLLEKRVSGLYLGEVSRLAILELLQNRTTEPPLSDDSPLMMAYSIDSSFLTMIARLGRDISEDATKRISGVLKAPTLPGNDIRAIRLITTAIVRRAARLAGAALAAIIIESGRLGEARTSTKSHNGLIAENNIHSVPPDASSFSKLCLRLRNIVRIILQHLGWLQKDKKLPAPKDQDSLESEEGIIDIGIDGLLFEAYPTFEQDVRGALQDVPEIGVLGEKRVRIGLTKDGSGVGAALVAQSIS